MTRQEDTVIARALTLARTRRFNPSMSATAREAAGLSQSKLAREIGVSQPLVGKWESEQCSPNGEHVAAICEAAGIQPELLYVDRPRRLASMSDFYHRSLSRARRTDVKAIHARCNIIDIQVDRLMELGELVVPEDRIPVVDPNETADCERIADDARAKMGVRPGPVENLVELIESCGGIIIDRGLEVDEVDALCRWVPELPKLFFINGAKPADRIRLSLAHELGHTVMHFDRDLDPKAAEDQANWFAGAFLLPRESFSSDIRGRLSLADLAALKRKWRVSMQAIAYRARRLGLIDERRYKSICVQMSHKQWRKAEPVEISRESPRQVARMLKTHMDAGYTKQELARLLFVTVSKVEAMLADYTAPNWEDQGVRLRLAR